MTAVLEELIVNLARDAEVHQRLARRDGIDSRIFEHFDVSDIRQRRTYLMCLGEVVSDVTVGLAVLNMPGRDSALLGDLQALKAHAEQYGPFPFVVVARGSWVSLQSKIHYPCLKHNTTQNLVVVELVPGTGYWPADTRFLLVDKPA